MKVEYDNKRPVVRVTNVVILKFITTRNSIRLSTVYRRPHRLGPLVDLCCYFETNRNPMVRYDGLFQHKQNETKKTCVLVDSCSTRSPVQVLMMSKIQIVDVRNCVTCSQQLLTVFYSTKRRRNVRHYHSINKAE